jgi:hypothetical protein
MLKFLLLFLILFIIFYLINLYLTKKNHIESFSSDININNLFDYCDDSIICNNALFSIGEKSGNTVLTLSVNNNNNFIYKYSNEWLYLINGYYPSPFYDELLKFYYHIINNKEKSHIINEDVISFITSFSTGTTHGYTGLYYMISEYLDNIELYKDKKIIVAKNSQSGILDIINHLCSINIIDSNKIIYLEKNIIYNIYSITFIPNKYHAFTDDICNKIEDIINKYIIPYRDIDKYKSLNLDNICIIKGSTSDKLTENGVVPQDNIIKFANLWNLTILEPGKINEIELINCISEAKLFIVSMGTAFEKNSIYISDKCKKIIVLVIGEAYINQYNSSLSTNLKKYKNAEIIYKIVDENLDFNPYE